MIDRIAGIIKNDVVNGIGVCVSVFTQGCPHHCKGCFNPETWDKNGGYEVEDLELKIVKDINANGIQRNLSILGGEPLYKNNRNLVMRLVTTAKQIYPSIKIFIWTGYTIEQLQKARISDDELNIILNNTNYIIDGLFNETQRDYSLWLRGSRNQNVYELTKEKEYVKIDKIEGEIVRL